MASQGTSGDDIAVSGTTQWRTQWTCFIHRYHDSIFAGQLGVSWTVYRLLDRVYWPGLCEDVRSYLASCSVCLARNSPCLRRAPMGHVSVGDCWDRVIMYILDMSVTTPKGNRYVLVMVDCFSRPVRLLTRWPWLSLMSFLSVGWLSVGSGCRRSFIRIRAGNSKTIWCRNYDFCVVLIKLAWLLIKFNRTLLIMLAKFAGEQRDDWEDLLPAVMMAYRSSVHESTGFSLYCLMFRDECTLGLPYQWMWVFPDVIRTCPTL